MPGSVSSLSMQLYIGPLQQYFNHYFLGTENYTFYKNTNLQRTSYFYSVVTYLASFKLWKWLLLIKTGKYNIYAFFSPDMLCLSPLNKKKFINIPTFFPEVYAFAADSTSIQISKLQICLILCVRFFVGL